MLVERQKLRAMLTSRFSAGLLRGLAVRGLCVCGLAAAVALATPPALPPGLGGAGPAVAASPFVSAEAALEQGLGAYTAGRVELAINALEAAAEGDARTGFVGQFYLARILADNSHRMTNHGRAYDLYLKLADDNTEIDPEEDQRAPFVAKSLLALANYTKSGVPELGLRPNPQRAAQFIHQAATVFSDEDAQFELAKLFLSGDGIDPDVRRAVHWFSVLSQRGHPGAQAYLADLYWRGKHVPTDQRRALILITLALETAPVSERIWMEDIHQNVFCGSSEGTRTKATGEVADWRQKYGRVVGEQSAQGFLVAQAPRTCSDGRSVPHVVRKADVRADLPPALTSLVPVAPLVPAAPQSLTSPPAPSGLLDVRSRAKPQ